MKTLELAWDVLKREKKRMVALVMERELRLGNEWSDKIVELCQEKIRTPEKLLAYQKHSADDTTNDQSVSKGTKKRRYIEMDESISASEESFTDDYTTETKKR